MCVCVRLLSILRFAALKFLFRFLFEVYKVLTECLRSPFLSLSHALSISQCVCVCARSSLCSLRSRHAYALFQHLALACCLSQLLLLPPTEADVATRRCASNYIRTRLCVLSLQPLYMCVCVYACIWVKPKFLERKLVEPLAALQMDESDMAI